MIIDQRIYTLHPGCVPKWLAAMQDGGFAMQSSVLGRPVGYYYTEFGPLNQVTHMWAYDDLKDREKRRAQLSAIPEWQEFRSRLMPLVHHQENKLLMPAPFWSIDCASGE